MYKLQQRDLSTASTLLGKSFNNYPIFEYIIPDAVHRSEKLEYLCHFLLALGIINGEVVAPSNKIEGVSIWLYSTGSRHPGRDALRAGLLTLFFHLDVKTIRRFIEIGNIKGKVRTKIMKGSFYICDLIGVDPLLQRQGIGRKMIEAKLLDFDTQKVPCYLETSKFENIAYYKRYGFSPIHQYKIMDVDVFCLLRKVNTETATRTV